MINPLLLLKPMMMSGLALWVGVACFNNIIDKATNRFLLGAMFAMQLLKEDGQLGQGLLRRSWENKKKRVNFLLWLIVGIQAVISLLLCISASLLFLSVFNSHYQSISILMANWSLLSFMGLWLGFLCGGLWFGYWIKMGHVQVVHLLLLIISLLAVDVVNIPIY